MWVALFFAACLLVWLVTSRHCRGNAAQNLLDRFRLKDGRDPLAPNDSTRDIG